MADVSLSVRKLRTPEAASYVGLSPRTLEKLRISGDGPLSYKLGARAVRYDPLDLDAWLARRRRTSTSGP
jgi:predicted DNA-binding transcriptional regulator AlpA